MHPDTRASLDPESFTIHLGAFRAELDELLRRAADRLAGKPRWRVALSRAGRAIAKHPFAVAGAATVALGAGYAVYRLVRR